MRAKKNKVLGRARFNRVASCALIFAATALFVLGAQAGPQVPAKTAAGTSAAGTSKGNAENGKQLYTSSGCYECHGRQAQGSRYSGPRIGPSPLPFPMFKEYVRAPKGQMPPYTGKVLTDAELADIHAFLESLPVPPAAKTIPLLN